MNAEMKSADSTDAPHNPLYELTGTQRDLLAIVHRDGASTGQSIKETYAASMGEAITNGLLYPSLDTIAERGLIDKSLREPDGRTNTYELTDRGLDALVSYNHWITGGEV